MTKSVTVSVPSPVRAVNSVARLFLTSDVPQTLSAALHSCGFDVAPVDQDAVAQASGSGDLPCAVVWSDPARCLAVAIAEGGSLSDAVEGWQRRAEDVLAMFRRNRRGLTLVDAATFSAPATDPAWDVLGTRLKLSQRIEVKDSGSNAPELLALTLARLAVPQIESLRDLLEELRASSASPSSEGFAVSSLSAVADAYADQISRQEEMSLMKSQLALQLEEAERTSEEGSLLQSQVTLLARELQRLTEIETAFEAQTRARENDQKELGRLRAQAEVEAEQAKQASEERALLQSQVTFLTREMQRLTEIEAAFEAQTRTHEDDQEELGLLRAQVELQLEEARRADRESAALRAETDRLTRDVARLMAAQTTQEKLHEQTLSAKSQELTQTTRDLGEAMKTCNELAAHTEKLGRDVEGLTTNLAMVYESTSWRVTAPLRGVKSLFSKGKNS